MPVPYILIQQKAPSRSDTPGQTITYARCVINHKTSIEKLATSISLKSTLSMADIIAVLYALGEELEIELMQGNKVYLNGLGSFTLTAKTGAISDTATLRSKDFTKRRIRFEPDHSLRKSLDTLSFVKKK